MSIRMGGFRICWLLFGRLGTGEETRRMPLAQRGQLASKPGSEASSPQALDQHDSQWAKVQRTVRPLEVFLCRRNHGFEIAFRIENRVGDNYATSWQHGYGAFSVSESNLDTVVNYVQNQEYHHRGRSFQEEYRELCHKHCVEIDERYVWD